MLADALAAGAKLLKPAQEALWGGYSGYFSDPDGFLWEVAWNPSCPIAADGSVRIPNWLAIPISYTPFCPDFPAAAFNTD